VGIVDGHLGQLLVHDRPVSGAVVDTTDGKPAKHDDARTTGTGIGEYAVGVITDNQQIVGTMRMKMETAYTVVFRMDRYLGTVRGQRFGTTDTENPSSLLGGDTGVCDERHGTEKR
jgi:hypothetical protein